MNKRIKRLSEIRPFLIVTFLALIICVNIQKGKAQDGEQLFQQCKACHTIGQGKLLGPDLLDVTKRHEKEWLKKFIKSSQTMIKKGDPAAVKLFEENNKMIMIDYNLSDAELEAIVDYLASFSTDEDKSETTASSNDSLAAVKQGELLAQIDTDENEAQGKALFMGTRKLKNGGPSCISCHHVSAPELMQGGMLAKDLTHSFSQIGGFAGLKGILEFPPFPAMKDAYAKAPLTPDESIQLQVFMMRADKRGAKGESRESELAGKGLGSMIILLILIAVIWFKRKKRSVNYQIIQRQRL